MILSLNYHVNVSSTCQMKRQQLTVTQSLKWSDMQEHDHTIAIDDDGGGKLPARTSNGTLPN